MNGETARENLRESGDMSIGVTAPPRDVAIRDELAPFHDHTNGNGRFAHIHDSIADQLAVAITFIREGLERGERCLYVVDERTDERRAAKAALRTSGIDVDQALDAGTLSFHTAENTYLRRKPFEPEQMVAFYGDIIESVEDAYPGLRVTAGTAWLERIDFEAFMEYEGRVNKLFQAASAKALCHYNRNRLPEDLICDVIRSHPYLIFNNTVCTNVYYIPPDELFGPDQPEREVDRMIQTLTERAEAQAELEASHARLEEFASAVSHDLKTPLDTVASYLQLLERRYEDQLDEDAEEFIDFAVSAATRMREMIDGVVTTYAQVGQESDPFEPVELQAVLEDVRLDLDTTIRESGADITATSLPVVHGQHGQLRQVFLNLIDNAIKYAGDAPPRVHVAAAPDGEQWIISVRDEGIGIDPQASEVVFDVSSRLHRDDRYPGTGIGLALCKRIIERHGGEIWVESEPGDGSTFFFTVPAVP